MQLASDAARVLVEENTDLAVAYVVKFTSETALNEMKKLLDNRFMARSVARMDLTALQKLPDKLRPNIGTMASSEMIVYASFSK